MSDAPTTIGARLRHFIDARFNGDVPEFAHHVRLSQGGVYQIISGRSMPNVETLTRIVRATPMNLHWLITGDGAMEVSS